VAALWLFHEQALDVIILEVGLGGRFDAVNVIAPHLAMITTIALDHVEWLGDNREAIAKEKAGIFRQAVPVVCTEPNPPAALREAAHKLGCPWVGLGEDFFIENHETCWDLTGTGIHLADLPNPNLPLPSVAGALRASCLMAQELPVSEAHLRQAVANASLPGRYQRLSSSPLTLVDVAHNPESCAYLAKKLNGESLAGRFIGVLGMLETKDLKGSLEPFSGQINDWFIAPLKTPLSAKTDALKEALPLASKVSIASSIAEALAQALSFAQKDDIIVGFGSFYTVREMIESYA